MSGRDRAETFFLDYLAFPVVILFYVPYKVWFKTPFMRTGAMDLQTGRRELDTPALIEEEKMALARLPRWKRIYKIFC
jgi:amino acid transporter